jgi:hypothetical protein
MGRCTRVNILAEIFQEVNRQKDLKMEEKGGDAHDFANVFKELHKTADFWAKKTPAPVGAGVCLLWN